MKRILGVVGIMVLVAMLSLSASAVTVILPPGPGQAHLGDNSNLFSPQGAPRPITLPDFVVPALGDENRAVFEIDQILGAGAVEIYSKSGPVDLTGLFYDLTLVAVDGAVPGAVNPTGTIVLYFAATGRNPLTVDVDGDSAAIPHGGVIEIFADDATLYDVNQGGLGPAAWLPFGGSDADPLHAVAADAYPTVSDGDLWLAGALVHQPAATLASLTATVPNVGGLPILFVETINMSTLAGVGTGFMNVFGGDFAPGIGRGTFDNPALGIVGADVQMTVNLFFPGTTGYAINDRSGGLWQVASSDPVNFTVVPIIPEPTVMALFGLSILGGFIRRRRSL